MSAQRDRLSGSRARRRLLFIEDHDDTRLMYLEHFQRLGFQVETARCGNDGIAAALRTKPDVIVVDLMLPELDGWDTTALLSAYPTTATTPIVACTAVTNEDAPRRARALGCRHIVRKPCLPADVEEAIDAVLASTAEEDAG